MLIRFLLLCVAALTGPLCAQLTEATLKGYLYDRTGHSLPAAKIIATSQSTGQIRTALTDDHGLFVIPALAPGAYTVTAESEHFKTFEQSGVALSVGQTTELNIHMDLGDRHERVEVVAEAITTPVATEARLSDTFSHRQIAELPVFQRDIFALPKLSAGATAIPGAANSTKLTNSPVITVNGNRYRGNDYVLDGSLDVNPNNTGEPAIVPSLDSVDEAQVQTGNFSSEFGRGNGAVVNLRTKSGSNELHGRLWEYDRNAYLNARNFFGTVKPPQVYNQFGANAGGPIVKNQTFFFGSYEGTRNALGQSLTFQAETPEFRNYVLQQHPNSIAATLLAKYPAPAPVTGTGSSKYVNEVDVNTEIGRIPGTGLDSVILHDYLRFNQYLTRVDHNFKNGKDKLTARWISEYQRNDGGTSSSKATLGQAVRGFRGPFDGLFGNLNAGYTRVFDRAVNDARFSYLTIGTTVGGKDAVAPQINITGVTMPFGDVFLSTTKLRTAEFRDTLSIDRGSHLIRVGLEGRRITKGIAIGPAGVGAYSFNNILDFAADKPFQQTLTVDPISGQPVGFPRYFTLYETGAFIQDDWKVTRRLTLNLGVRHDYFGTVSEEHGLLSSVVFGAGDTFDQRLASAKIGHVDQLYHPQKLNFSPRLGVAYDPFGDGTSTIRAGFSLAFQPHHGQSISGARALPPDAVQGLLQPNVGIGNQILYGIPVPFNSAFATGLNQYGGIQAAPGQSQVRITGFVVNPTIKTQYSENFFVNLEREVATGWVAELGFVRTHGVNLERIEDVNRQTGDLLDGKLNRINGNFGPLLFVTNGVSSDYNALTAEIRHNVGRTLTLQANYRWSKWLDTSSDTSTGQFLDNDQPGKGSQDADCLKCERGPSMFDIPHRFTASVLWAPNIRLTNRFANAVLNRWQLSTISTAQSGRPFSVWNGASFQAGGDYNADGGGGAVGGGYYDRPDAPAPGVINSSFSQQDFIHGLFSPTIFPAPTPGTDGNLGRNTFRGPHQLNADVALSRAFAIRERTQLVLRAEAFNALNKVNLYLPNTDLSLALKPDKTFSTTSSFGKSTSAFDGRALQGSVRIAF